MGQRVKPAAVGAIYEKDGARLIPTRLARGPWHAETQHGGPMQGLLARAIEQHPTAKPMQIVRFTCDLWRAAPFAPVTLKVRTEREGKSGKRVIYTIEQAYYDPQGRRVCALLLRTSEKAA